MTVVMIVATSILSLAALLTIVRLIKGPSMLDRLISVDVLLTIIVSQLGVAAAFSGNSTFVPVLVVVALLGFVGSASVGSLMGSKR